MIESGNYYHVMVHTLAMDKIKSIAEESSSLGHISDMSKKHERMHKPTKRF